MEKWIDGNDVLLLKPDNKDAMVVLWWKDWVKQLREIKDLKAEIEVMKHTIEQMEIV